LAVDIIRQIAKSTQRE